MRTKLLAVVAVLALAASAPAADLSKGTPDLQSAQALAFGPNGLLFVGDPQGAAIFAIDTGDAKKGGEKALDIPRLDAKIASVLGASDKEVRINDIKVNPTSGNLYVAATRGTGAGQPAIVRITRDGNAEALPLKDVMFAKVTIPNPGKSNRDPLGSITSMAFVDGKLIVAGLSSEEFASTLRVIPYPFGKEADKGTAIEIFHGAHNAIETRSPIRTFVAYKIDKQDTIMAAYTCTPLVKVPVSDLKPGVKVKGTTIAELGSGNQPLDMIAYTKDGKDFLLIANTSRGVMKVPAAEFGTAPAITTKPTVPGGVKYETVTELKGVVQLDKLDDGRAVILVKVNPTDKASMAVDLKTIPLP
jgi:hypothetical protein